MVNRGMGEFATEKYGKTDVSGNTVTLNSALAGKEVEIYCIA